MNVTQPVSTGWLSDNDFRHVVAHTPLVSLDFVVTNPRGEWLLGQRLNRPAQGSWFVPGGRIRKNEPLEAGIQRLTQTELGQCISLASMHFLGVYQHFYADSMLDPDLPTHYVVLAYQFSLALELEAVPCEQHDYYHWWPSQAIATTLEVHANTRAYLPAVSALIQT